MMNKIKFVQANANRSKHSHDLIMIDTRRKKIDILLTSEPNEHIVNNKPGWKRNGQSKPQFSSLTVIDTR